MGNARARIVPRGRNPKGPTITMERTSSVVPVPAIPGGHSTVTLLARLRGWSTSQPRSTAIW